MPHNAAPADSTTSPRAIWSLTWPQLLMMYVQFFSGFVTVWTAGRISADLQAALGMISQCGVFFLALCLALSSGGMAAVSQSFGAGRMARARRYVAASIGGTALLGCVMALVCTAFGAPFLRLVQTPDAILPLALDLWPVAMLALPFQYLYASSGVMFRASRQVLPPLWVAALVCAVTLIGCLGFGLGFFGLPNFGAQGIIWTHCGGHLTGAAANLFLLRRRGLLRAAAVPGPRWLRAGLPYLLRVALPAGAAQIVWQTGYLMLFVLVASLPLGSVHALAGLTAGLRIEALLFMPGMAFNMSAAVLVGNCLGAGDKARASRVSLQMVGIAAAIMSLVAAALWPFRQDLAAILSHEAETRAVIVSYLTYNLLSTPFSIASTVMGGVMAGAGATRYNLMVYGGTFWLLRLPLGWLLGHRLWGTASGVFCAMLVSQCLQTFIMLYVLRRRDWARFAMRAQSARNAVRPGTPPSAGGHDAQSGRTASATRTPS